MAYAIATVRPTPADVDEHLAFADAALALAGHEVTDPALRAILERQARHELTRDDARAAIRQHFKG